LRKDFPAGYHFKEDDKNIREKNQAGNDRISVVLLETEGVDSLYLLHLSIPRTPIELTEFLPNRP
jgi:hypothetical protein